MRPSNAIANAFSAGFHLVAQTWDGLISTYEGIVLAGESHGRRHARPTYHAEWLRRFPRHPGAS
ncbi:hypothetical protein DSM26151_13840 [Agromyces marinus]|nr:hypothetical protein DSM26151_13840 [Agromyces marinus]